MGTCKVCGRQVSDFQNVCDRSRCRNTVRKYFYNQEYGIEQDWGLCLTAQPTGLNTSTEDYAIRIVECLGFGDL